MKLRFGFVWLFLLLASPAWAATPQCLGLGGATAYTLVQGTNPGSQVWNNATGAFIANNDAGFATWMQTNAACPVGGFGNTISAAANNGSGAARLTVGDTSLLTTNQYWYVQGTPSGIYDGVQKITVINGTQIDLVGSTYSVTATTGALYGPQIEPTAAQLYADINAYNQSFIGQRQGYNAISSAVDVTLTNTVVSFQSVTMTASSKKIIMPAENLFGSIALGQPTYFYNAGANSFGIYAQDGSTLIAGVAPGITGAIFPTANSTQNGTWSFFNVQQISNPATGGNMLVDQGVGSGYTSIGLTGGISSISVAGLVTLGNPGASTKGGVESITCSASNWINTISTGGVPSCAQPAGTDLSGTTLASSIVTSSLTTVGTIGTGTWAGTTVAVNHGGTGDTGTAWSTFSPTITCGAGTIGAYSTQAGRYKTLGKTVFISLSIAAAIGTCSGTITIASFPVAFVNASTTQMLLGRDLTTGLVLQCTGAANGTTCAANNYLNSAPTGSDAMTFSGVYESN